MPLLYSFFFVSFPAAIAAKKMILQTPIRELYVNPNVTLSIHSSESRTRDNNRFHYESTDKDANLFGPKDWSKVNEDYYPYDWKNHLYIDVNRNKCRDCSKIGQCKKRIQSPINLVSQPEKKCRDTHKILPHNQRGDCNWEELRFSITPSGLRAEFPKGKCDYPSMDLPNGWPDPFLNIFLEIKTMSEHTINGKRFDGEIILSHIGTGRKKEWIANIAILLEANENYADHGNLEKYIVAWEKSEAQTIKGCRPRQTQMPTSAPTLSTPTANLRDITSPDDIIFEVNGESEGVKNGLSPPGEGVENAIDNTAGKYLNYEQNGSGMIVIPSIGWTIVKGIRIFTANDFPGRDPASFKLEGFHEGNEEWFSIAEGNLNLPNTRNDGGKDLNIYASNQVVTFSNEAISRKYRLIFPKVKSNKVDRNHHSMQVAEIEILGEKANEPCIDDNNYTWGRNKRTCRWTARNPLKRCWQGNFSEKCQKSCGHCTSRMSRKANFKIYKDFMTSKYYWRYTGSLTVPPCKEKVEWRVLDTTMKISKNQIRRINRLIHDYKDPKTCENIQIGVSRGDKSKNIDISRPIQSTNDDHELVYCSEENF